MKKFTAGLVVGLCIMLLLGTGSQIMWEKQVICDNEGKLMVVNLETGQAKYIVKSRQVLPDVDSVIVNPESVWTAGVAEQGIGVTKD